jgi:hypothetical protein
MRRRLAQDSFLTVLGMAARQALSRVRGQAAAVSAHEPEVVAVDFLTPQVRRAEGIQAVRPSVDELARGHQVLLVQGGPDPSLGPLEELSEDPAGDSPNMAMMRAPCCERPTPLSFEPSATDVTESAGRFYTPPVTPPCKAYTSH